ncbi:orotate phosphoribosyltransferase [Helicovermis profundi]|uniref:Orotate phosphoribosyltransferase n=1 Tax=Helicovermis profundi TaxID=3065157 RepID=A0AAU9EPI0_9FIRM|nr:orotate phosphoribosyltransferase [Clostridia bacterium S502]
MSKIEITKGLLEIGAVSVKDENNLFTWVSGIKSPIYCDNRLIISYPDFRKKVANEFCKMIKKDFNEYDVIAGTATAGIPHAMLVADILDKPMIYVRSGKKAHGKGNQIEGVLKNGDRVILIEDLFSTGGSSINAVEAIEEAGAKVLKVYGIFNYNFSKLSEAFKNINKEFETITDYNNLIEYLSQTKKFNKESIDLLKKWNKNPTMFTK